MGWISSALWPNTVTGVCADDGASTGNIANDITYHHAGLISWDGDSTRGEPADQVVALASGVFQRDLTGYVTTGGAAATSTAMSLDYVGVGDGTTNTLMLSENLQAGDWWDTSASRLGFGIQVPVTSDAPSYGSWSASNPLQTDAWSNFTSLPDPWFLNRNLSFSAGQAPRPSSQHAGGVNVIFCDGSGRFLSENMDKHVYAKLVSSNGVTYGEQTLNSSY